jgi:chromate transporter
MGKGDERWGPHRNHHARWGRPARHPLRLLAFGGGGAALPLVERLAVGETGWASPQDFAAAVACGYVTPGPVLITTTFVGYRAAGLSGAVAATVGVFLMPWFLAAAAAQQLQRFMQHPRLAGFGRGAAPSEPRCLTAGQGCG